MSNRPSTAEDAISGTQHWGRALRDCALAAIICLVGALWSYHLSSLVDPALFGSGYQEGGPEPSDVWFDADVPKTLLIMTDPATSRHKVATEHPLISLVMYPPAALFRAAQLSPLESVRAWLAVISGAWLAALFGVLRTYGCRVVDALLFTTLASASSGGIFFMSAPDAFIFGSTFTLISLILLVFPKNIRPILRYTIVNVLNLSLTITNWFVGIFACIRVLSIFQCWVVFSGSWFIVSMLWAIQKFIFPESLYFIGSTRTARFVYFPDIGRIVDVIEVIFIKSIVMPPIQTIERSAVQIVMSIQRSGFTDYGPVGFVALSAWIGLIALSVWSLSNNHNIKHPIAMVSAAFLVFQSLLHTVFGGETFLYSPHYVPILIILVASTTLTRFRVFGQALAVVTIVSSALNNWSQFSFAVEFTGALADRMHSYLPS